MAARAFALSSASLNAGGVLFTITAPKAQLSYPQQAELNGNVGWTLNIAFTPDAGNDEIEIALT